MTLLALAGSLAIHQEKGRSAAHAPKPQPASRAALLGRVELAASATTPAAASLPAGMTVVVYAYALDGPRLPLAVLRRPASALPLYFNLDDSLATHPAFRISQAVQVVVGARMGLVADAAQAQPGDWVAPSQTVALGSHPVRLVLQPPGP